MSAVAFEGLKSTSKRGLCGWTRSGPVAEAEDITERKVL